MSEMSKQLRLLLIFDSIVTFVFMFFYLIIPEIYASMVDSFAYDPYYWRAFGATLLVLGIMALVSLKRADMSQIKLVLELAVLWIAIITALTLWELIFIPISPTYWIFTLVNSILLIFILLLNAFFYYKEFVK
ncbi:MAG: hypothetical protein ACFFAO_14315 [Candidatus Hermodarchaeota archaeon]